MDDDHLANNKHSSCSLQQSHSLRQKAKVFWDVLSGWCFGMSWVVYWKLNTLSGNLFPKPWWYSGYSLLNLGMAWDHIGCCGLMMYLDDPILCACRRRLARTCTWKCCWICEGCFSSTTLWLHSTSSSFSFQGKMSLSLLMFYVLYFYCVLNKSAYCVNHSALHSLETSF